MLKISRKVQLSFVFKIIFLVFILMAVFGYTNGRFIFVKAYDSQINIYPGSFVAEQDESAGLVWLEPGNSFVQDLSGQAVFSEFTQDNSTYLGIPAESGANAEEDGEKADVNPTEVLPAESADNPESSEPGPTPAELAIPDTTDPIEFDAVDESTETDTNETAGKELSAPSADTGEEAGVSADNAGEEVAPSVAEEVTPVAAEAPASPAGETPAVNEASAPDEASPAEVSSGVRTVSWVKALKAGWDGWRDWISLRSAFADDSDAAVDAETVEGASGANKLKQSLVYSDFSVPVEYTNNGIGSKYMMLSFAALSGYEGDSLTVEYEQDDEWLYLGQINLITDIEFSNGNNGGYFQFKFPDSLGWSDIAKLKVRLSYDNASYDPASGRRAAFFIDAIWLKVDYNEAAPDDGIDDEGEVLGADESGPVVLGDNDLRARFDLKSEKTTFAKGESPSFVFEYRRLDKTLIDKIGGTILNIFRDEYKKVKVTGRWDAADGGPVAGEVAVNYLSDGRFSVELPKNARQFRPGKHRLQIEIEDSNAVYIKYQDFYWGVMAFNTNKSVFQPGETAHLQLGVLDDTGHTVCDADLYLEITAPDGGVALLNTENGLVLRNPDCDGDSVISGPDYDALYGIGGQGIYRVKIVAVNANGFREFEDSFEVRENIPVSVERIGPTRIYPLADYEMKILITADEGFQGNIIERVPENFSIYGLKLSAGGKGKTARFETVKDENMKVMVIENVSLEPGRTYELSYRFDAPNVSPEFYLLGPLSVGEEFSEFRMWQIASDEVNEYSYSSGSYTGTWTSPGSAWDGTNNTYAIRDIERRNANEANTNYIVGSTNDAPANSYTITTVEIGIEGYVESAEVTARLVPSYNGTPGSVFSITGTDIGVGTGGDDNAADYVDITSDKGGSWSWSDISSLDIKVYGSNSSQSQARMLYVDSIRVKVTYEIPNDPPSGNFNTAAQKGDGSGVVDLSIEVDDPDDHDARARLEYQAGTACTFSPSGDPTIDLNDANTTADFGDPVIDNANLYQVGTTSGMIVTASGTNTVLFDWNTKDDIPSADGTYCLRLSVIDEMGATSTQATTTLTVDNVNPTAPGSLALSGADGTSITLAYGATTTDTNFTDYVIYYKEYDGSSPTESSSPWASTSDSNLASVTFNGATHTTITDLFPSTQYIFNIWAYDAFGNKASATVDILATTTAQMVPPISAINYVAQTVDGSGVLNVSLEVDDGNDDAVRVKMEYESGGSCAFAAALAPVLDESSITADYGSPLIDGDSLYQIGTSSGWIVTASGSNSVLFDWNTRDHDPVLDGLYCVRFTANDLASGDQTRPATTTVFIDNTDPTTPGPLSAATTTDRTVTLTLGATTTEVSFAEYRIYYKSGVAGVGESDSAWTELDDANLGDIDFNGATTTEISGLNPLTTYYFRLYAYDDYGNKAYTDEISASTLAAVPIRARTVSFLAGTYTGNGTTGRNSDTNYTFSPFNFRLAENGVEIQSAYIVFESQFESYADNNGSYTGYNLAFDVCEESCAADAFSGTGRVLSDDNTVLAYDESESNQVRLLMDVSDELELSEYAGGSVNLEGRVGYNIERGSAVNSISYASARLVVTYTYLEDSTDSFTNTVYYPLDSTAAGDSGTRQSVQAASCTLDSNCPTFSYRMDIPEIGTRLDHWFQMSLVNYDNNQNNTSDITLNVNIESAGLNSYTFVHENANAGSQGSTPAIYFGSVSGLVENTDQVLEANPYSANYTSYLLGGEVGETYVASTSAGVKTRTASFPIGVVNNGNTTAQTNASVDVYFPENGSATGTVMVKSAWLRIKSSNASNAAATMAVATRVGNNSQSGNSTYNYYPGHVIIKPAFTVIHIIPAADYAELADANSDTAKTVTVYTTNSTAAQGGISAELMVTYTYSDEANGYLSSLDLFAGQSAVNGNARSDTPAMARIVAPENVGTKTMRAGALLAGFLFSDSSATMPAGSITIDANISTGTPVCTDAYIVPADGQNAFADYFKSVTAALVPVDNLQYNTCYSNNGGADATAGAKMNGSLIYTYQYTAQPPELTQNDWRWYLNYDDVMPGAAQADENTAIANVNIADILRMRVNVGVAKKDLATSSQTFILEYGEGTDCTAIADWHEVGAVGSSTAWTGYDNGSVSDGVSASTTLLSTSDLAESYEEQNPTAVNLRGIERDNFGEWDFALYNNNAVASADYCFRLAKSDGTPLDFYALGGYPRLTTAPANTAPQDPEALGQFRASNDVVITNTGWINENSVKLSAAALDANVGETISLYFEVLAATGTFATATTVPAGACLSGAAYESCSSHVWAATSTPGDYRTVSFAATATVQSLPDKTIGYKWQVLACDADGACSAWAQPAASPNFRVDTLAPSAPGNLSLAEAMTTGLRLSFGATTTETNFSKYRIFYQAVNPGVTEIPPEHIDPNMNFIEYNGATSTLVSSLSAGTVYYFNIWAYDFAGNKASSSIELNATTSSSYTPPTGSIFSLAQATDGSGAINITLQVDDPDNDDTLRAKIFYEAGSACTFAPPLDPTIDDRDEFVTALNGDPAVDNDYPYQVGTSSPPNSYIVTSPGINFVFVSWLSKIEEQSANGTYCIGMKVNDGIFDQAATATRLMIIDNVAPSAPAPLTLIRKNRDSVTVDLVGGSADPVFDRYRIFYSTTSPVTVLDHEYTDYFGATTTDFYGISSTTITGLESGTTYYFEIWAYDDLGNRASSTVPLTVTTNSLPANVSALGQFLDDEATAMPNGTWVNRNELRLSASANDPDASDLITHYFQFVPVASSSLTATTVPQNACVYGTSYDACQSKIWFVASTSAADWSVVPYSATTSITGIPDSGDGYKWQVLTCDDDDDCANDWTVYNAVTPNVKVDTDAPSSPGPLSEYSKSTRTAILSFGAATDEAYFREYVIYYSTTSPVTEASYAFSTTSDSNLSNRTYGSATTTIGGLEPDTTYYFSIWAYDQAGNKASSTEASVTTNAVVSTPGVFFYAKNDRTLYYKVWSGSSWSAERSGPTIGSLAGDNIRHVSAVRSDDGNRVSVLLKTWDGTNQEWWLTVYRVAADDFVDTTQFGTAQGNATNNQLITGCMASLSGGEFFAVRNNNTSNGTIIYSWNAVDGWTSEAAGPDPGGVLNGCRLERRPDTDNYLLLTFDDTSHGGGGGSGDVGSAYYYGGSAYSDAWTNWTEHGYPEEDTDNYVGEAFFDPSDNTRGGINYSASNSTNDTKVRKFVCSDSDIQYGLAGTSPATWSGNFVSGEFGTDPGGVGTAFYAGRDLNGDLNVYQVDISAATPAWTATTNGDNISASSLYAYTNDAQSPFAIVFYKSGAGLAAWNQNADATPKYRLIAGGTNTIDSSNTAVPDAPADTYSRVRFYDDPNEEEFLAVYQDNDNDFSGVFWDGMSGRFYSTTTDSGSEQVWTVLAAAAGAFDYDDECTTFAYTAGNANPDAPYLLRQYRADASTTIANASWTNENTVTLTASVRDSNTSEVLAMYLNLVSTVDDLATTTGVPQNACDAADSFTACNSKVWLVATSSAGDYSTSPFTATATVSALPSVIAPTGYKWQVKACDDDSSCTSWIKFNVTVPNFMVDAIAPTAPGALVAAGKTSVSVTLNFGATTTEDNFSEYKIFYKEGASGLSEDDLSWTQVNDPDLAYISFNGTANTVITGLSSSTQYVFNIWAYDLAGNKASSTLETSTTTNAGPNLVETSFVFENDDGADVNSNSNAAAASTTLAGLYKGERVNLRIQIENNGGDTADSKAYKLQFENTTDASGTWVDVGAATQISYASGLSGTSGDVLSGWKIANGNTWIFGQWHENIGQSAAFTLDNGEFTELAFAIHTGNALVGKTYRFRLFNATNARPLDGYLNNPTLTVAAPETKKYSKGTTASLAVGISDQAYYLDPAGYNAVAADDGSYDQVISSANYPVYNFVTSTTTNTYALSAAWNGNSSVSPVYREAVLQVYRFGTTNAWVTVDTENAAATSTDFSLTAFVNSTLTQYYDGSNRTYWRVYQASGDQTLATDDFTVTFIAPTPDTNLVHYRWRHDDGDEASATWREEVDAGSPTASTSVEKGELVRLRLAIANDGSGAAAGYRYRLEYATTTGDCTSDPGGWQTVLTDASGHWQMAASSNFSDGASTTGQLSTGSRTFTPGYMVENPSNLSGAQTINESYFTEIEYAISATVNANSAGTYCFRATDNGTPLDGYDRYPVLTLSGVANTAPFFTTFPFDNNSATNTPTLYGDDVVFTANAEDDEADDYYLAVCKTASITAGNDGPPVCSGGAWCISELASSTVDASCNYTTATTSESLPWYAYACDKYPGFAVAKCSPVSQGDSSDALNSPFVINHPPVLSAVVTSGNNKDPGGTFTITTTSYDNDTLRGTELLNLFVCNSNNASFAGCNGNTICSTLGTSSPNAKCSFTDVAPTPAGDYTYYAFVFDYFNAPAAGNSKTNTYHVNNVAPILGTFTLNSDTEIILSPGPATTTVETVLTSVIDYNGCASGLVSAIATIYMSGAEGGTNCAPDDNDCYQITTANCLKSDCVDDNDVSAVYTCTAALKYFAFPTDNTGNNPKEAESWRSYIRIYDGLNYVASSSHDVELITTLGIDVPEPLIDFGSDLFVGDNTGTRNATTTIVNIGNCPIDTNVRGTHMNSVPTSFTLTADNIKYSLTPNFNYVVTGSVLSTSDFPVDTATPKPSDDSEVKDEIFWGIGIPFNAEATVYYGRNTFTVMVDTDDWPL